MKPPRLPPSAPPPRVPRRGWLAPLALLLTPFLLAGAVHVLRRHGGPLPECAFHRLTGLPCAFCGSTRALDALGGGHPLTALALNPLLVLASVAAVLGGVWGLGARRRTRRPERPAAANHPSTGEAGPSSGAPAAVSRRRRNARLWAGLALGLILLNWAYLLLFQR